MDWFVTTLESFHLGEVAREFVRYLAGYSSLRADLSSHRENQ